MQEIWKPVVGYEGTYEVSNTGRIRSLDRFCSGRDGRSELHRGKELKPWTGKRGQYLIVGLRDGRRCKKATVHSIVAAAFLGPRPNKHDVMHLDGNRQNNCVGNLRYGTRAENLHSTYLYGGKQARGKLSLEDVKMIRLLLKQGRPVLDIAAHYQVDSAAIYHIRDGKSFAWFREACAV